MSRIIKAHQVNIAEDNRIIDVPVKDLFIREDYGGSDFEEEELALENPEELLRNAERHASDLLESARETAERIIEDAKVEAESQREAIFEDARNTGYDKGYREAHAEGEELISEANRTLEEARQEKERLLREAEPEAVEIVIEIIEKLVGDIVKLNPGVIMHLIKTGIEGAPGAKQLFIRVSSDDYPKVEGLKDEVLAYVDSDTNIEIIKDASLKQGDCVIDTPIGSVESSLGVQWGALKNDLIQILKARGI